jgi:hypothetical protein
MCNGQILALFIIGLLVLFLFMNRRSNFRFDNSDYQYSNPNPVNEISYYRCLFEECRGDTDDYDCLEKCKFNSFHGTYSNDPYDHTKISDIRDRMCDYLPEGERWKCLNNIYKKYGYNFHGVPQSLDL